MWPPEPPEPDEVEVICEGDCLDTGYKIIWFAYGAMIPDDDGYAFEPGDKEEVRCPWCERTDTWSIL